MAMPNELILVRHGESEANVIQHAWKRGEEPELPEWFHARHDWKHPLSETGREQARVAAAWLIEHVGDISEFEGRYVSPFIRARQTAYELGRQAVSFWPEDRIIERDWGAYGATPHGELETAFPHTQKIKKQSPWYVRYDGGESLNDVMLRLRDFNGTLHREMSGKKVIAVTHGELIWTMRYLVERMLPEEWEAHDGDKSQRLINCSILWYSRTNPDNHEDVRDKITWRRLIRPTEPETSPYGGEWVELPKRRPLTPGYLNLGPDELVEAARQSL